LCSGYFTQGSELASKGEVRSICLLASVLRSEAANDDCAQAEEALRVLLHCLDVRKRLLHRHHKARPVFLAS
jgi:hypothetical protein